MKNRFAIAFVLFLGLAVAATAQTPAPAVLPDAPQAKVVLGASAIGFKSAGGTHSGMALYAGLQVTPTITASYEQVNVTSIGYRYQLGMVTYSNSFDKFLGKKITSHTLIDWSNYVVTAGCGAGHLLTPTGNHIAESCLGSLSYPLPGGKASLQVISYQYIHAPSMSGTIQTNNQQQTTTGIMFHLF
jgi:hypothetical protein